MERGSLSDRGYDVDPIEPACEAQSSGAASRRASEGVTPLPSVARPDGPAPSPETGAADPAPAPDKAGSSPPAVPVPADRAGLRRRIDRTRSWWAAAPDNLRGSVLMIAAFVVFSIMTATIKAIGTRVSLPQVLLVRQVIMTLLLLPLFMSDFAGALRTNRLGLQVARGIFSLMSMLCGFTAILHIPLADATALSFSQVLFVTVLAVFVLKEAVGWRRWAATLVGFVGVLVMLRPTGDGFSSAYGLLALAGAMFGSGITVMVRMLAQSEKTATILLYQAIIICAALIVPTVLWWQTPTPREWMLMVVIGVVGTAGQYLITRAYQIGEAAALAPLDFIRLLIATAIGFVIFAELPSWSTFVGGTIVIGATVYTVRSNAGARPRSPKPSDPS